MEEADCNYAWCCGSDCSIAQAFFTCLLQSQVALHTMSRVLSNCAGIIFTVCSEPYLLSEYGAEYMSEAPVKLLERLMHGERLEPDEQVSPTCC